MDHDEIIATIRATPDEVQSLCAPLSDGQLRKRPGEGDGESGWSLIELICHLRDSAQEDDLRIRRLVEEDNPTLVPYDQAEWARDRDYQHQDVPQALMAMRAMVTGLANRLESLSDEQWSRGGTHPERGAVTVAIIATQCADHDRDHLAQMRDAKERAGAA